MNPRWLIPLGIVAVIIVSGCTSNGVLLSNSLENIANDPQNHLNESISASGTLTTYFHTDPTATDWQYYIVDGQGYKFAVQLPSGNRDYYAGDKYSISGKVAKADYCYCQVRYVDVQGDFISSKRYDYMWKIAPASSGLKCDNDAPIFALSGEWKRANSWPQRELSDSCTSTQTTVFTCSYNGSPPSGDSFKDEYKCDPTSVQTIYYIDAQTATKI